MKKRVFIIHGWDGVPGYGWMAWIKEELKGRGFEVIDPQMPNAQEPKIEEWVPKLTELVGEVDENTYFIGHSIGCQTIMRFLERQDNKVGGCFFVAVWFDLKDLEDEESEAIAKPWIENSIDFEKVKSLVGRTEAILSDDDEWVELEKNKKIFEEKIGAKVIVKEKMGHFNEAPEITELLEFFEKI